MNILIINLLLLIINPEYHFYEYKNFKFKVPKSFETFFERPEDPANTFNIGIEDEFYIVGSTNLNEAIKKTKTAGLEDVIDIFDYSASLKYAQVSKAYGGINVGKLIGKQFNGFDSLIGEFDANPGLEVYYYYVAIKGEKGIYELIITGPTKFREKYAADVEMILKTFEEGGAKEK